VKRVVMLETSSILSEMTLLLQPKALPAYGTFSGAVRLRP
jgi:hypothetical protein